MLLLHGRLDRDVHDHGSCEALARRLADGQATLRAWPVKHEVLFEFAGWEPGSNPALEAVLAWLGEIARPLKKRLE